MDALVLAAGRGSRMGGRKARLLLGGVPLALAHARRARMVGAARVLVVADARDVSWIGREADVVSSAALDAAGSLAIGVRALARTAGERDAVLVVPVDSLPVSLAVVEDLAAALRPGVDAVVPTHGARGGHPALVRWVVLERYLEGDDGLSAAPPLRQVLRALGPRRVEVPVADPGVVVDLNTVDDVLAVTGASARFLEDGVDDS